ncbi:MAG: response regulator transcription factor [Anaerolineales bacterium]
MIRVVAVDDHPTTLDSLKRQIGERDDMQLVATADHGSKMPALVEEYHPDIVIEDVVFRGKFDVVAAVGNLKKRSPDVKVLIFTGFKNGVQARALVKAGARGYMLKEDASSLNVGPVILDLYTGGLYFSPQIAGDLIDHDKTNPRLGDRELHIITLLAQGEPSEVVAESLVISKKRLRNILGTIRAKLGLEKRVPRIAIINKARELGLLPDIEMDANLIALLSREEDDDDDLA